MTALSAGGGAPGTEILAHGIRLSGLDLCSYFEIIISRVVEL